MTRWTSSSEKWSLLYFQASVFSELGCPTAQSSKGKNKAGYGGRGIFVYRDEIEREFEHIDRFVEPGALFIDIGANTGIYTMKVAKHLARRTPVTMLYIFTIKIRRLKRQED